MGSEKKVLVEVRLEGKGVVKKDINDVTKEIVRLQTEQKRLNKLLRSPDIKEGSKKQKELASQLKNVKVQLAANQRAFTQYKNTIIGAGGGIKKSFQQVAIQIAAIVAAFRVLERTVGAIIKTFSVFEYTMMNVKTLLDETHKELDVGALKVMKRYGFAIRDVNKALFDAISAMIPVNDSIEFLNEASRLAVGGVTSLKVAVDGLTTIINAYQLSVMEAARISDALFRAQKFGKTTVEELVTNIGRVAPIAAIANISYQEMLATLAELTLGGLTTRESVTILRQAIAGLIKPAKEARAVLKKFNVPVGIAEVSATGLAYALKQLTAAAKEDPDAIAIMIPNIRAFTGAAALTGERLEHLTMITQDVISNFGVFSSLSLAFSRQMTTLAKQTDIWRAKLRAVAIEIGSWLKPVLVWLMDNTPLLAKSIAIAASAFVAFKIAVMIADGTVKKLIKSLFTLKALSMSTGIGLLVGLLTAAGAAFLLFRKRVKEVEIDLTEFNMVVDQTRMTLSALFTALRDNMDDLGKKAILISEINTKYEKYIGYQLDETANYEDIAEARILANTELEKEIRLKFMLANLDKITAKRAAAVTEFKNKIRELVIEIQGADFAGEFEVTELDKFVKLIESFVFKIDLIDSALPETEEILKDFQDTVKEGIDTTAFVIPTDKMTEDLGKTELSAGDAAKSFADSYLKGLKESQVTDAVDDFWKQIQPLRVEELKWDDFNKGFDRAAEKAKDHQKELEKLVDQGKWVRITLEQLDAAVEYTKTFGDEKAGEHKKGLEEIYKQEVVHFRKMRAEGKSTEKLTEQSHEIAKARKLALGALTDEQVANIDRYMHYTKKTLTYEVELTTAQKDELKRVIRAFNDKQEKAVQSHLDLMIALRRKYEDDALSTIENTELKQEYKLKSGYQRRLEDLERAEVKKIQVIKRNYRDNIINYAGYQQELTQSQEYFAQARLVAEHKFANDSLALTRKLAIDKIATESKFAELTGGELDSIHFKYEKKRQELLKTAMKGELDFANYRKALWSTYYKETEDKEKAIAALKQKYSIPTQRELYVIELRELRQALDNKTLTQEEYERGILELKREYQAKGGVDYSKELALLEQKHAAGLLAEEEYQIQLREIKEKYGVAGEDVPELKELELKKFIAEQSVELAQQTADRIFEINSAQDQREYQRATEALRDRYNTENEILRSKLDKGILTEFQYKTKKDALDKKARADEEKIKKKQWEKEQKRRITQSIINGLLAIAKTFATMGFPAGIPMAIAQGIISAALTVAIAAEKYKLGGLMDFGKPSKKHGAGTLLSVGGKPHSQGGTKFYGEDGSVFEAEQDELMAIINKRDSGLLRSLSDVNAIHGKSFYQSVGIVNPAETIAVRSSVEDTKTAEVAYQAVKSFAENAKWVVSVEEIIEKSDIIISVEEQATI